MSVTTGISVAALLHRANIVTPEDCEALAEAMYKRARTSPLKVAAWTMGAPMNTGGQLRALIATLDVSRQVVFDHVAPISLLPALWCVSLGDELARLRVAAGYNRQELADKAGVSGNTINRWEQAFTLPDVDALRKTLEALEVSAFDLLCFGDWPPAEIPVGTRPAFAQWLIATKERLDISEGALGRKVGVQQVVMNAWVRGRGYPGHASWTQLAEKFTDAGAPLTADALRRMQLPERASIAEASNLAPFARLLTAARLKHAMCIEVAADAVGTPRTAFAMAERGQLPPTKESLVALVKALGIDREDLVEAFRAVAGETRRDIGARAGVPRGSLRPLRDHHEGAGPRDERDLRLGG